MTQYDLQIEETKAQEMYQDLRSHATAGTQNSLLSSSDLSLRFKDTGKHQVC